MPTTKNPIKQRPTAVLGSAVTMALLICGYLFREGVIPEHVVKQWGWLIVVGVVALVFVLLWFHVSPAVKLENYAEQLEGGKLPDVDLFRIEAVFKDALAELTGKHPDVDLQSVGADHPDAQRLADVPIPDGMSAGAPAVDDRTDSAAPDSAAQ